MAQGFLKSLLKPQSYPEPTTSVHLLQTHVSFLFITDNFVYKIKKPVDFGFLNFTTVDRRRFYCNEEVRLNSRLCPEIYLGVVEVRESPDGATFCGEGKIIDYAVKMVRLPEERMLHRLLARGEVGEQEIRQIARTIGEFHGKAATSEEIYSYGSIQSIQRNWEENLQQSTDFINISLAKNDLGIIRKWEEDFISRNEEFLERRISGGFIRECDGDLHMENICLTDRVCIFDCIEFNRRFSCSDTAADISFLLMDLDFHRRSDLATLLMDEYIAVTGDKDLHLLVDFYKIYRAVVRGKVESFKINDPNILPEEKIKARERASLYFRLARGYILRKKLAPSIIITAGMMGSGKSTIAEALSFELGLDSAKADAVRKKIASVPAYSHDQSDYGEGIYSPGYNSATYVELLRQAEEALINGRSFIIDATFRRKADRNAVRNLAEKLHVPCYIIHTHCSEKIIHQRLDTRIHNHEELSDGRWELFYRQKDEWEAITGEEGAVIVVDTSRPALEAVNEILSTMGLLTCG